MSIDDLAGASQMDRRTATQGLDTGDHGGMGAGNNDLPRSMTSQPGTSVAIKNAEHFAESDGQVGESGAGFKAGPSYSALNVDLRALKRPKAAGEANPYQNQQNHQNASPIRPWAKRDSIHSSRDGTHTISQSSTNSPLSEYVHKMAPVDMYQTTRSKTTHMKLPFQVKTNYQKQFIQQDAKELTKLKLLDKKPTITLRKLKKEVAPQFKASMLRYNSTSSSATGFH